jgi:uncharacterized membrane protein YphA (DoxX/SURF4 family)
VTTHAGTQAAGTGRAKAWHVLLWVVAVVGAASFLMAGFLKLSGNAQMVQLFAAIGVGQWFRFLTGTLEVLGGVALLVPRLRALGALGLIGVMVGALITNFALHIPPASALVELVIAAIVLWGRRRELTPAWVLRGERTVS